MFLLEMKLHVKWSYMLNEAYSIPLTTSFVATVK